MVLNEKEQAALDRKIENPKLLVSCPRCGSEIKCTRFATAVVAKCSADGCIKKSLRGI